MLLYTASETAKQTVQNQPGFLVAFDIYNRSKRRFSQFLFFKMSTGRTRTEKSNLKETQTSTGECKKLMMLGSI